MQNQKRLDSKTLKAYRIDLTKFYDFMKPSGNEITKESISAYIAELHKNFKPKTVKRKIASIKAFFNYLDYEEIIEKNPFLKLMTKFQYKTIQRDVSVLELLFVTGARVSECMSNSAMRKEILRE